MTTNSKNIGNYSRLSVDPTLGGMVDEIDFPHSGLFKALAVGVQGNYAILNDDTSNMAENFSIVQTDSSGNTQFVVGSGKVMRDGKVILVPSNDATTTFTSGTPSTFDEPSSTGNGYFLLVVAANNTLAIRDNGNKETLNTVPQLTAGDIPIAMIRLSNGENSAQRLIQYFTTAKKENSVSIGYENSNAYTEVGTLTGGADGITMTGLHKLDILPTATAHGANSKVIIQDGNNSETIRTITAQSIADLAPQGDITGITAGTGLTGTDLTGPVPTLNVGGLTVAELAANSLQTSGESFADNDTSLMTSASIEDKILSYGYTTNVGDITSVVAGTGLSGGATTGDATVNLNLAGVIANDGANRVLTSDGDGTLTAEAKLTVDSKVTVSGDLEINGPVLLAGVGTTVYTGDVSFLAVDASALTSPLVADQMTLVSSSTIVGKIHIIKNVHASNNLTIKPHGSEKFDNGITANDHTDYRYTGPQTLTLRPFESIMLYAVTDAMTVDLGGGNSNAITAGWLIIDREYEHPNHTGDVTSAADGATTIANDAVTYAKMQNLVTANRVLGSTSTGLIGETQIVLAMMAANSVDSDQYVDASIDTEHIADNAVDGDKLADDIVIANTLDVTGVTTLLDNVTVASTKTFVSPRLPVVSLTASTTLSEGTHAGKYIFVTGSSIVITIPDNQGEGVHFTIINNDGNGFTLRTGTNSSSGDNMNGAQTDIAVAARNGVTCISTGTDYVVLGV